LATAANPCAARIAPNLPDAAEIPCPVDRTVVGKASAGIIKVVELGPKLKKNCANAYSAMNTGTSPRPGSVICFKKIPIKRNIIVNSTNPIT